MSDVVVNVVQACFSFGTFFSDQNHILVPFFKSGNKSLPVKTTGQYL